jgi:hypothetical protein
MKTSKIARSTTHLATAALLAAAGCGGQPPLDEDPNEGSSSGLTRFVAENVKTAVLEPAFTCSSSAAIFDVRPSVPVVDGAACQSDLQCPADQFCSPGAGGNRCHGSGLLQRDSIYYVAGRTLDLTLTVSACATISDVLQGSVSLAGTDGIDGTGRRYDVLSTAQTTFNGQDATRIVVRIDLYNFGDGSSSKFEVRVAAPLPVATATVSSALRVGGTTAFGSTASTTFTVAGVAAVNAALRSTISETKMRTNFIVSMYEKFGDADAVYETHDDGSRERTAHGLDWSELGAFVLYGQTYYTGTDLRIQDGQVVFSMKFHGDAPVCDTDVNVDGAFTLVPSGSGLQMQWLMGPRTRVSSGTICTLLSLGISAIITDIVVAAKGIEDTISKTVQLQMESSAGVTADGFIPVCPTCRVQEVKIGGGRIDIYAMPGFDSVRVNVSTTRYTDTTKDPNGMGLIIPPATFAMVASGGTYKSCVAADGTSAATCTGLQLDGDGAFNWWGTDVPVPNPWPEGPNGTIGYYGARHAAWNRLIGLGLTRHVEQLPAPTFPAGALLARRGGGASNTPGPHLRVKGGCMVAPDSADPATAVATRIALGVNDLPSVGTQAPTSGKLDATVLIPDVALSKLAFEHATPCTAEPPSFKGLNDLTAVTSGNLAAVN